jgi:uncharacterized spore protein YtfJ
MAEITPTTTFVERLAAQISNSTQATTIFAPAVERDGATVIPVARARWGFGGGGNASQRNGASNGGGGGVVLIPVGYIEIAKGQTRFRHIIDMRQIAMLALGGGVLAVMALREVRRIIAARSRREEVVATIVETPTTIPQDATFAEAAP